MDLESSPDVPDDTRLAAHVFDENGEAVCHCALERRKATLHLPRRLAGRVITIAVAAERKTGGEPTLPGIQARGAHVVRTLVPEKMTPIDIGRVVVPGRWFRRSCCRVPALQ